MQLFNTLHLVLLFICTFFYQCKGKAVQSEEGATGKKIMDTLKPVIPVKELKPYNEIVYQSVQKLKSSSGTKSVVFSKNMKSLYAMNLEGMSVCEFSQSTKSITRIFKFRKTPGVGWNYETDRPVKSFEEKPVEAFLSHNDSILWVSLHNAEGVVPIHLLRVNQQKKPLSPSDKLIYLQGPSGKTTDSFYVPLIKTGKTPKVIACTSDDRYLLVSNWHSLDVSVLEMNSQTYPYAQLKTNIPTNRIPRGIVIDTKNKKSYVAIMGGSTLSVIDNNTWTTSGEIQVAANPRHVVQDDKSRLYVSYNKLGKIGCIDPVTGETLFTARTASQPRSMALSKNNQFLFVTCYNGNKLMVFKILEDRFEPVIDMNCSGNPVGVDVFENDNTLEVWVCAYETGTISVYTFEKK
jgi:DNA-binding beta-propeller fold protein YncE